VQRWEGPIEEIRPGDGVWFAPGEKHWRGAAPLTAMTHVAIVEVLDGKSVDCSRKFEHDGPILGVEVDISSFGPGAHPPLLWFRCLMFPRGAFCAPGW
jgi:hypothetical protein